MRWAAVSCAGFVYGGAAAREPGGDAAGGDGLRPCDVQPRGCDGTRLGRSRGAAGDSLRCVRRGRGLGWHGVAWLLVWRLVALVWCGVAVVWHSMVWRGVAWG